MPSIVVTVFVRMGACPVLLDVTVSAPAPSLPGNVVRSNNMEEFPYPASFPCFSISAGRVHEADYCKSMHWDACSMCSIKGGGKIPRVQRGGPWRVADETSTHHQRLVSDRSVTSGPWFVTRSAPYSNNHLAWWCRETRTHAMFQRWLADRLLNCTLCRCRPCCGHCGGRRLGVISHEDPKRLGEHWQRHRQRLLYAVKCPARYEEKEPPTTRVP
jgi:hypothetical protein